MAWCGQYYNSNIWLGMGYYSWIALSYKDNNKSCKNEITKLTNDNISRPWDILKTLDNEAFFEEVKVSYKGSDLKDRFIPHVFAMLHMLAPEYFIDIVSAEHKRKIIDTFKAFLEKNDSASVPCNDETIYYISERMKTENPDLPVRKNGFINFYDDEIRVLWDEA